MAELIAADSRGARLVARLRDRVRLNLKLDNAWEEVSGAVGDLGTFVPIVLALTLVNGLDLGTTLLFTGAYNVVTGLLFGVPMPVQPMKAIAAVAITEGDPLTVPQIMAAGITTALVLVGLGITGLMSVVNRFVPLPVVRGVQLSQGISFGMTAVNYILKNQNFNKGKKATGNRAWLVTDGRLLALFALLFVVFVNGSGGGMEKQCCGVGVQSHKDEEDLLEAEMEMQERKQGASETKDVKKPWRSFAIPTALILFVLGLILALGRDPSVLRKLRVGPSTPHLVSISRKDWKIGFVKAAIPQIPLSVLNSVIAVCKLSKDLFPKKEAVTPFRVSVSNELGGLLVGSDACLPWSWRTGWSVQIWRKKWDLCGFPGLL